MFKVETMYGFKYKSEAGTATVYCNGSSSLSAIPIKHGLHIPFCKDSLGCLNVVKTQKRACKICLCQFESMNALLAHVNSGVHEVKRYACESCNKRFASLGYLMQHLDTTGHVSGTQNYQPLKVDSKNNLAALAIETTLFTSNFSLRSEFKMRFDGSAYPNPGFGGCGCVITEAGVEIFHAAENVLINGYNENDVTNHQSEYYGMILGLSQALNLGIRQLQVEGYSELVIRQMAGRSKVCSQRLIPLNTKASELVSMFQVVYFKCVPREFSSEKNDLSDCIASSELKLFSY